MNLHVPVGIFRKYWDRLLKGESISLVLPGRNGPDVKAAFRQVVKDANQCVVRVQCDGQDVALGTIVGPDGWVLTKASELKGRITCRLRDGRELEAQIKGICPPFDIGLFPPMDLAMLKIDALHLPIIGWSTKRPSVGQWLATAGMGDDPLGIGIVSVPRRAIPPVGGVIGVLLRDKARPRRDRVGGAEKSRRRGRAEGRRRHHPRQRGSGQDRAGSAQPVAPASAR